MRVIFGSNQGTPCICKIRMGHIVGGVAENYFLIVFFMHRKDVSRESHDEVVLDQKL